MSSLFNGAMEWLAALCAQTWLWVALIGFAVGTVELVSRYRDNPLRAVTTFPALIYIALNVAAGIIVLAVLNIVRPDWLFTSGPSETESKEQWLYLVLTAGFGAVALLRSSLFKLKGQDGDVAIGPSFVLDTLLNASDRGVDRVVASPRGQAVAALMKDVSFERARNALPTYCFALMQNVAPQEQKVIADQVNALANASMDDRIRALNLGLALLNVVGERVLSGAVKDLGDLIKGDPPVEDGAAAKVAALMAGVDFDKARIALPAYCFGMAPLGSPQAQSDFAQQLRELADSNLPPRVRSLILGLTLAQLVSFNVLQLSVQHLGSDIAREA
ncbi:MAG: hypothetical protein L0Y50_08600 [Beijerinckiaceae bacterium]|nr:hypothetical protein [Beijerinckiaceae bacterium]MCI0736314.1 hypothetical protein [Beijerinckiaceae bacterium]